MTVYRSYSDYTTKGGGVIEGLGGGRRGKLGTLYSKTLTIPKTHSYVRIVNRLIEASPHISRMELSRLQRLENDLALGYTVKIRDGTYLKTSKNGNYEIHQLAPKTKVKKQPPPTPLTKEQRKATVDATYQHLLEIQRNAIAKRNVK